MEKIWLREMLRSKSLRHKDVAQKAMISRAYFTQIVIGKRRPSPQIAKRIADVLGFGSEWYRLLEIETPENKKPASAG